MNKKDLQKIINYIIKKTLKLKDKYTQEKEIEIDYICIFSQRDKEYRDLKDIVSEIGELVWDSPTGPVYKLKVRPQTPAGKPVLLRIRIPDKTRLERGDVDFNTDYPKFKNKYLKDSHFKLIEREDYEMIELMDIDFDVRVYFSSTSFSKTLRAS